MSRRRVKKADARRTPVGGVLDSVNNAWKSATESLNSATKTATEATLGPVSLLVDRPTVAPETTAQDSTGTPPPAPATVPSVPTSTAVSKPNPPSSTGAMVLVFGFIGAAVLWFFGRRR